MKSIHAYFDGNVCIPLDTVEEEYKNSKVIVTFLDEHEENPKMPQRKLGFLKGKAKVTFSDDWEMTEEEFVELK